MKEYLERCIFLCAGESAAWQGGLHNRPPGFRTYASNAQERSWRTLKGLLPRGFSTHDSVDILAQVCAMAKLGSEDGRFAHLPKALGARCCS